MPQPIVMPQPGQMTETCSIIRWLKKEGDAVAKGDILYEIETDKSAMEVESFAEGTLLKILVRAAQPVPVRTVVGFIGTPGEAIPDVAAPAPAAPAAASAAPQAAPKAAAVSVAAAAPVAVASAPAAAPAAPPVFKISPRAARLAKESVIDPTRIRGTGPGGRVKESDVVAYLNEKGYAKIRITPTAKVMAAREKIDILSLEATDDGRIDIADVERAIAERPKPLSRMRQVIAQRMLQAKTTAPHIYVTVAVDVTDLAAYRAELKAKGFGYTVNDFVLKAVASTLRDFPQVNSFSDGRTVKWNSRINVGMAVNIDGGLVVPVLRNADRLSMAELREQAVDLAGRARQGKLKPDEMAGGTFTVSNMGMMNVENFLAIINPGEGAILAVATAQPQPVVRNGQIVVRTIMKMTLSADHRLLDGGAAAVFVNAIKAKLEDLELWKTLTS